MGGGGKSKTSIERKEQECLKDGNKQFSNRGLSCPKGMGWPTSLWTGKKKNEDHCRGKGHEIRG